MSWFQGIKFEPALVRAFWTAVVALAASLGLTLPNDLPTVVEAVLPALAVILPVVQGFLTRAVVTPNTKLGKHAAPEG
jgi:hypothetical protein